MKRVLAAMAVAGCATALVGCGVDVDTNVSTQVTESADTTSTNEPTSSSTASSTTQRSSSPTSEKEADDLVDTVARTFSSLAPEEFFAGLENCHPNGIPDSYSCDGPKVGQFQFFDSDVKATSTAQVLRELSSSRVVEESGNRIVGWSVLGSTAIITVVDEKQGLTMQQMISSDKVDPSARIKELGLADQ